jgi:peptidoglycan/LPS O-acetylase OafA/YrhL
VGMFTVGDSVLRGHTTWPVKVVVAAALLYAIGRGYRCPDVWVVRRLADVGKYSYSIYLAHMLVGARLPGLMHYWFDTPARAEPVVLVLAVAVSALSGVVFYYTVERRFVAYARRPRPSDPAGSRGQSAVRPGPRPTPADSERTPPLGLPLPIR